MTTNASRLKVLAAPLRAAGMEQLNISLDTLGRGGVSGASRPMGELKDVLEGIDAAVEAGFPVAEAETWW